MGSAHPIGSVAVVGAGLMGRRIAGVVARSGLPVVLTDSQPAVLDSALTEARSMAPEAHLVGEADLAAAVPTADLLLAALVEDLDAKRALFVVARTAAPDALLASNSSVIPISRITEGLAGADRTVGMHWWNPPDLIPIVEVIRGEHTSTESMDTAFEMLEFVGKIPVRVQRDVPGFVGNRLQHALWREAIDLVASGVCDAETVDLVVRNTIGLRLAAMGPIENADYVGLDLTLAIHDQVLPSINSDPHPSPLLRHKVAAGELGAKSGQGFLTWPVGCRDAAAARLAAHISRQVTT
ncbi:MAG: 3-hydroxyacyl-CoA dehydrogenase NAD-binding domain-containing protein [Mycobacterium sp.]|nr:3-hydroxyacyl-CoA dehydrogenase NAD-binding domain-containing protein [Mycobacterium sp.]